MYHVLRIKPNKPAEFVFVKPDANGSLRFIQSMVGPKPMMIKLHKDKRNSEESTLFLMVNENPRNRNVNHLASELQNRFFPASGLPQILGNAVLVRTVADEYLTEHRTVQKRETHGFTQNDKDFLYFTYSL